MSENKIIDMYLVKKGKSLSPISKYIGDRSMIPKIEEYSSFYPGGQYHFLLKVLPAEILYIIFEMKFMLEKIDYTNFYFDSYKRKKTILHISKEEDNMKYYKPDNLTGLMYNDFNDILLNSISGNKLNFIRSFKQFIERWYYLLYQYLLIYKFDCKKVRTTTDTDQLIFKGNFTSLVSYNRLYGVINQKIMEFYDEIIVKNTIQDKKNRVICKILIRDIIELKNSIDEKQCFWTDYLDNFNHCELCSDFFEYFYDFEIWVKEVGIKDQIDLINFLEYQNKFYINPFWFEKEEEEDDFPLWTMIQEFC